MKKHLLLSLLFCCSSVFAGSQSRHPVYPAAKKELRIFSNREYAGRPVLIPEVQKYRSVKGTAVIPEKFTFSAPAGSDLIAGQLDAELAKLGSKLVTVKDSAFCRLAITDKGTPENPQGYRLVISSNGIEITSRGTQGLFYGAQTLRNLLRNAASPRLACCDINDWPDLNRRGYFFTIRRMPPKDLPKLKKAIDAMASLKLNWLLLEFAESFPYKGNPLSKSKNRFTETQVRDLVNFCRERHIEITPLLQVWSHALWMTFHPDWEKMRESKPNKPWNSAPCPLNQQARDLTAQAVSEQIELIKPKTFCLTLDEVYLCPFRQCRECKKQHPQKLLNDYFKFAENLTYSKGVQAMICQDTMTHSAMGKQFGPKLCDSLDKRSNILWWSYNDSLPAHTLDMFLKNKLTITGHALSGRPYNGWIMARLMKNIGSDASTIVYWWYSRSGTLYDPDQEAPNSLGGFVTNCDYMWNISDRHHADMPYDGVYEMMRRMYPEQVSVLPQKPATPIPLHNSINAELSGSGEFPCFKSDAPVKALKEKLSSLPEKFQLLTSPGGKYYGLRLTGDRKDKNGRIAAMFNVDRKAAAVSFLLTSSNGNNPTFYGGSARYTYNFVKTAEINIRYADKTSVRVPLRFRRSIAHWNQPYGGSEMRFAVRGIDDNNMYYSFGIYDFINPHPEKKIANIIFHSFRVDGFSPVLLAASLIGADRGYGKAPALTAAKIARQNNYAPAAAKPAIQRQISFDDGDMKGAYVYTTGTLKAKDVKTEIVEDPTAPTPGKVLKLTIPPAEIAGTGDAGAYIRVSLDMPYKLPAKAKSILVAYRLSDSGGLHHAAEYLVASDNKHYWMRSMHPLAGNWNVDVFDLDIRQNRASLPVKDFSDITMRRVSFYFHRITKPLELYIDDIATSETKLKIERVWTYGSEPSTFR